MDNNNLQTIEEEMAEYVQKSIEQISGGFTFFEFINTFDIFEYTVSTLIGIALATIVREITPDILFPIIKRIFFKDALDTIEIYGAKFDLRKIISDVIFLIVFVTSIYLFFRLFFKETINQVIKQNKEQYHQNILIELQKIQLLKENNELMKKYFGR